MLRGVIIHVPAIPFVGALAHFCAGVLQSGVCVGEVLSYRRELCSLFVQRYRAMREPRKWNSNERFTLFLCLKISLDAAVMRKIPCLVVAQKKNRRGTNIYFITMKRFFSCFCWVLIATMSLGFVACNDEEEEQPVAENTGGEPQPGTTLGIDLSVVSLSGNANSQQSLTITSNKPWTLSGVPDWLNASATAGNGTATITLMAISENSSATERSTTITITAGDKSVTVQVKQRGLLAVVSVVPMNIVALWNGVCFEPEATGDIHSFYAIAISEDEMKFLTDKEIVRRLLASKKMEFAEDYWLLTRGIDFLNYGGTPHYICTVAFDKNEKQGELVKTKIEMPQYYDSDSDAWVYVEPLSYDGVNLQWGFTKQAYCHKYHAIMGGDMTEDYMINELSSAFEINYYLKYGKKHWLAVNMGLTIQTNYLNDHVFDVKHEGLLGPCSAAFAWGVFENGKMSSDIEGGWIDTSNTGSASSRSVRIKSANDKSSAADEAISLKKIRQIVASKK